MGLEDVKVMYATTPQGARVTIPLIQAGSYDVDDIANRLRDAGVRDEEMKYVVFSRVEPPPQQSASFESIARVGTAVATRSGVEPGAEDSPEPEIPVPTRPNIAPPPYSELGPLSKVAVTPIWRQQTGSRYSMARADQQGYVVVQDLQPSDFQDQEDYHRIHDGRIKLCYGYLWRRGAFHFLREGDRWVDTVQSKRGMSATTSLSITASLGYSNSGVSASLSMTFGYTITVNSEDTVTKEVSVSGTKGQSQTAALWEKCRKWVLEVDGVVRDESNPYSVVFHDKGGSHMLLDTWGPHYDVVSDQPTLMPTIFPETARATFP